MSNSTMMSAAAAIPASSRKVVQSLKEIVDCPEQEIYSMLKECNMDPSDTINRLLSQDTFQEVKTKRERKKEVKEASESRTHGIKSDVYASHNGQDGEVWGWDSELEKPQLYSSTSRTTTKQTNPLPQSYISHSESISAANQEQSIGTGDWPVFENPHLSAQPSSGSQPAWSGVPGHASMADVVRMGKPNDKSSSALTMSETISEPASTVGQHANHGTWPVLEQSRATSVTSDTEVSSYPSSSQSSRANLPHKVHTSEVVQGSDDIPAYSGQVVFKSAQGSSHQESAALNDMNSYHSTGLSFEHQDGVIGGSKSRVPNFSAPLTDDLNITVSSTSASFQQLGLGNNDSKVRHVNDNNAVIIPSHLQTLAGDCSHLTFGTLKFGNGREVTSSSSSTPIKNDLEKFTSAAMNRSSHSHLENRTGDYHSDEQLRSMYDSHRVHMDSQAYDSTITSKSELMNPTIPESTQLRMDRQAYDSTVTSRSELRNHTMPESTQLQQDVFPSSLHGYDIQNRQQLSSSLLYTTPESSQLQQDVFPSSLHGYDIEKRQQLRYTMPYAQANRHTIDTSSFSSGMPNTRTGITTGPTTQQSLNLYSQGGRPMGQAADMDNYPIQPQTYAYSQSANQQAYSDFQLEALESNGLLPSQYKNSSSVNNLPQSAVNASGYGKYGNSTSTGNFLQNPSANPTYDDILSSLYKGGNQYRMPQQNDSSAMTGYVPSSITNPSLPGSLYYELQRRNQSQNQEQAVYRQGQQQVMQQGYGGPEYQYSSYDHRQRRFTQDDEPQKYFTANGIQGPSSNQSQNNWQHRY